MTAAVTAWRIFAPDDGTLLVPFGPMLWPEAEERLRKWPVLTSIAGCVTGASHWPPVEDCTCGSPTSLPTCLAEMPRDGPAWW